MTKAYTISRLISEVSALRNSQVSNTSTLASALSPRAGSLSVKFYILDSFLNGQLAQVVQGNGRFGSLGKTPRTRVVRALRARANGEF
jgi:hypothetical protein